MHIPAPLAFLAICAEFFGGLGLIIGFLTRIAVLGIAANMIVAIATVHRAFGFFMNWSGDQKCEGFEFHLLVLAITLTSVLGPSLTNAMIAIGIVYAPTFARIARGPTLSVVGLYWIS